MEDNPTETKLPSNDELYRWICLNEQPPESWQFLPGQISSCRARWHELKSLAERLDLLEPEFEGDVPKNFHQRFWELHLPKAFSAAGLPLSRGAAGHPDFHFDNGSQTIHLEAVACGEPQEQNAVPPPGGSFFSNVDASYINQALRGFAWVT